jgi:hypothetical protein
MGRYLKYRVKINDYYVSLPSYNDDFYNFVKHEDEAYLFYTFKQALKVVRQLYLDERFAHPVSVLIERVEFTY